MPNHSITPDLADHGDLTMHVRINQWLDALVGDYDAHGHRMGISFTCDEPRRGQRYVRIVQADLDGSHRSVHAFYDQRTGDVYKAAGWKAPAKIVRFNLLDDESFATMINTLDWSGGYLYLR